MKVRIFSLKVLIFLSAVCALVPVSPSDTPAYLNPSLPIDQRVDDLVSRMTLEEKASQVVRGAVAIPRYTFLRITGGPRVCTAWRALELRRFFLSPSASVLLSILP